MQPSASEQVKYRSIKSLRRFEVSFRPQVGATSFQIRVGQDSRSRAVLVIRVQSRACLVFSPIPIESQDMAALAMD